MIQIHKVLVPVDFSDASRKAARYGLTLALQSNAALVFVHVIPGVSPATYVTPPGKPAGERALHEAVERDIQALIPPDLAQANVRSVVKGGDVEEELLRTIEEEKADLVVMGSHGRRNPGRWLLGSVTEHLLRKITVPVMTVSHVQSDLKVESGPATLRHILYATDLSDESRAGLDYAIQIAKSSGARLTAVHVVDDVDLLYWGGEYDGYIGEIFKKIVQGVTAKLKEFVAQAPAGPQVETVVLEGKPYRKILELAEDKGVDLIILSLQGKGKFERAVLGSTAERVVRGALVPVLAVPVFDSPAKA